MRRSTKVILLALVLAACSPTAETTTTSVLENVASTMPTAPPASTAPTTTETVPQTTAAPITTPGAPADVIVSGGVVDGPDTIEVLMGETVGITVLADVTDEIHVHGFDLTFPTEPGVPTVVTFTADAQGIFEVELEEAELPLFELVVVP